jgi:hypothetical protein
MSEQVPNPGVGQGNGHEAEETLRLLAKLPPPAQLAERVHRRLAQAQAMPVRRGFWSLWMPARRVQFAAAAALVLAVAGSTWSVYHRQPVTGASTGSAQAAPATPGNAPDAAGAFGSAKVERVPPTLTPIHVPPVLKKKPGAGHTAKPSPKTPAAQPSGTETAPKSNP